ncbi:MAG: ZIP family metal transporter [Desulfarculaceae bacterium]|nr:ZIP family metal transporter [Desulfarculaceae bacterium]MCF8049280.1 ZIP family metal transporter [Desulfarculaceae bacterium]MCF8064645.1 ZIP family metal transporter [Desulfarculaceae bacterium]MCF8096332.1 ZIP family metal transporter [Desulfarculaceae bacterium]MCF8123507.1 ZIP family metal transporter [Desulfarculaceae bacterium]
MVTIFEWIAVFSILAVTAIGGYLPLTHPERARRVSGFPIGQSFAAGVFLALSLVIMLPAATHNLGKAFPGLDFPVASVVAILIFAALLWLEQSIRPPREGAQGQAALSTPAFPLIMTGLIAVPSFFLGVALGVSDLIAGVMILAAILAHKGTAGFALALKMARSTMSRGQSVLVYCLFACSTPVGILVGEQVSHYLSGQVMAMVKGGILSLAAGTFLYMSTLHELEHTPLIADCRTRKGFAVMLLGFAVTALVRLLLGEAHHF